MVTDACIDSRNFDSWQFRQTAIDVNDAIVRFLRDLFALLDPQVVQRLILVYFSRFVLKEGKHWQDRDSKIGLRCSWETCKLRMNAAALLVRLPDFHDINMPLMNSWGSWVGSAPEEETIRFFDDAILQLEDFDMSGFINPSYAVVNETLNIANIQQRKYRGFKRDEAIFYSVRDIFIEKKSDMLALIKSFESDFDNASEYEDAYSYIESFFDIIEDDKKFKDNVVLAARTK